MVGKPLILFASCLRESFGRQGNSPSSVSDWHKLKHFNNGASWITLPFLIAHKDFCLDDYGKLSNPIFLSLVTLLFYLHFMEANYRVWLNTSF